MTDRTEENEVNLDLTRENRTGLSEAIFCEGKQPHQLTTICDSVQQQKHAMLFTRMSEEQYHAVEKQYPELIDYDPVSRTGIVNAKQSRQQVDVSIITAGSSDVPVAREALRTLAFYGFPATTIDDIGVAGLWRLTDRIEEIQQHKIVICLAGLDAALPTVLGGLISSSIIAVPTSIGYGMAKHGETALHALLVSCASGITVVNIDNGYGAACAAIRILNQFSNPGLTGD